MQRPTVPPMPLALRRAIAIQLQRNPWLVIQLKDIKDRGGTVVGTYTGIGAHERNYESRYERSNRDVGVSYFLNGAVKSGGALADGTAVVHAHIRRNGQSIEGISIKEGRHPNPQAQWISPENLSTETAADLSTAMQAHAESPLRITNLRKVARETGIWPARFESAGPNDTERAGDSADIWEVDGQGWITSHGSMAPSLMYDAQGDLRPNYYTSRGAADTESDRRSRAAAPAAATTATATVASSSSSASAPSKASVKRARKKAAAAAAAAPLTPAPSSASAPVSSLSTPASRAPARGSAAATARASTTTSAGYGNLVYAGVAFALATAVWATSELVKYIVQKKPAPGTLLVPTQFPLKPNRSPLQTTRVRATPSPASCFTGILQPAAAPCAYHPVPLMKRVPQGVSVPGMQPRLGSAPPVYRPVSSIHIQPAAPQAANPRTSASRPGTAPPVYRPASAVQPKVQAVSAPALQPRPRSAPPVYRPTYPTLR